MQFLFVSLLLLVSFSFVEPVKQHKITEASPAIELIDIQPADSRGGLFYMTCIPKIKNGEAIAQFSASFKIKNKESKSLTLKSISYHYKMNGINVVKSMVLDIDDETIKTKVINPGGTFSWQNSRDYHEVDNAVEFSGIFPTSIQIKIAFEDYSTPYIITRSLKSFTNNTTDGAYGFPGKTNQLKEDEYWYTYGGHGGGGQFYAYDILVQGWDADRKTWSSRFPGKDGKKNEDYRAYGKSVVAIGDGTIIDFEDGVKENIGNGGGGSGGGNWMKINNGKETVCYYHMQPGTLTKSLKRKGAKVKKGDELGKLGNSGNSSEPHSHIHVIQDPDADGQGQWVPLNLTGIYAIDKNELGSGPNPNADWSKVEKKGLPFLLGRRYMIWPSATKPCYYPDGLKEIARHMIPENKYQQEISKIWSCGYYPVWVDAYDVSGKTYFNAVFRYNFNNYPVEVRHDMTKETYQAEYTKWVLNKKYRLQQIESYYDGGKLKFAAIFIKKPGAVQAQPAYHAQSPQKHQQLFESYSKQGYVPINVSVVSVGGNLYYSAFYEKRNVGGSMLKSSLTQQEYQDKYDEMREKKWEQVYINAYHHNGKILFSVIWYQNSGFSSQSAVRKSSPDSYQNKWEDNVENGLLTRCVTGYGEAGKHWFAAHWAK